MRHWEGPLFVWTCIAIVILVIVVLVKDLGRIDYSSPSRSNCTPAGRKLCRAIYLVCRYLGTATSSECYVFTGYPGLTLLAKVKFSPKRGRYDVDCYDATLSVAARGEDGKSCVFEAGVAHIDIVTGAADYETRITTYQAGAWSRIIERQLLPKAKAAMMKELAKE